MPNYSRLNYEEVYSEIKKFLPQKIWKKLNKTAEARSGSEIYKRRNNRNARALLQYVTWDKQDRGVISSILNEYASGYIVMISPKDYFGDNYPDKSDTLNPNFVLGTTGFVYYSCVSELTDYPPLEEWKQLIELDTKSTPTSPNWCGDYALNIKNAQPPQISFICQNAKQNEAATKRENVKNYVRTTYPEISEEILNSLPQQSGIGNYDYDFTTSEMQTKVKLQMAALLLSCKSRDGSDFASYLVANKEDIICSKDTAAFKRKINSTEFITDFDEMYQGLVDYCISKNLLNYNLLRNISAVNAHNHTICPLCRKELYADEFFEEILQAEGRQVYDNTQREIVLMHITALRPGVLNHKIYNLGWGHNYCNLIQGDKSISETIDELRRIVASYDELS